MEWEMREGKKWSSLTLSVAREMTPFIMCLPHKYEELSSIPSIYQKKNLGMVACSYNPRSGEGETGTDLHGSLAS